jgi:hypothetical protein
MKKVLRALMIALLTMICDSVLAQYTINIALWHSDNTSTTLAIKSNTQIKLVGDKVVVKSSDGEVDFTADDVTRLTYVDVVGIGEVKASPDFTYEGNQLVFQGISSPDEVAIYQINGSPVKTHFSQVGNSCRLSLSLLPRGIYVVKYKGKSIKFARR